MIKFIMQHDDGHFSYLMEFGLNPIYINRLNQLGYTTYNIINYLLLEFPTILFPLLPQYLPLIESEEKNNLLNEIEIILSLEVPETKIYRKIYMTITNGKIPDGFMPHIKSIQEETDLSIIEIWNYYGDDLYYESKISE
jgi:hypothetical protein